MNRKKIKNATKRKLLIGVSAVIVIVVCVLIARGVRGIISGRVDTSAGVEYIRQEEEGNISEIEAKIALLEKQEAGENDERSIKEKFSGSVVVGDSIAEGFAEYVILNASSVVTKIGVHLTEMDELVKQVKKLSPGTIFLALGENDVTATAGDIEKFISQYEDLIAELQKEVPDAHIFVNAIFPVQDKAVKKEPELKDIAEYNAALKELCDNKTIGFIDNTEIVEQKYYEPDGVHFTAAFYPVWAERMAEVASL